MGVIPASATEAIPPKPGPSEPLTLDSLTQLALSSHPRLAQAAFSVEVARGRAIQAGLYPNPTLSVTGDELGDVQGPGGIWSAPYASQEIVNGGKLTLSRAAANAWALETWQRLQANGCSKKRAVVALARRLLVRCWAILRTGRPWAEPAKPSAAA